MNHEVNTQIEIVDLAQTDNSVEIGVELSDLELHAVSGGLKGSWSCGRPKQVDEWE